MKKLVGVTGVLVFLFGFSHGRVLKVPEDYPPPNAIQRAINDASNGDTVSVRPGDTLYPAV